MVEAKVWLLETAVDLVVVQEGFSSHPRWRQQMLVRRLRALSRIFRDVEARLGTGEPPQETSRVIGANRTTISPSPKSNKPQWEASFNHSMSMQMPSNLVIVRGAR
jgi:hypothetical protein